MIDMEQSVSAEAVNRATVEAYIAAFNQGDLDTLRALFAEDALVYGVLGWGGVDVVAPIWQELHAAFALHLTAEDLVSQGDTVAVRYTERGTFRAPFRGQPPTGKSFELVAMEWFELRDGKIRRRWGARDSASQARQIGLPLG